MLPLRERIFPDVDVEIEDDNMWICSIVRKKHTDGKYYLTEVKRSITVPSEKRELKHRLIHQMVGEFNFMVYMYLMYAPVEPRRRNMNGVPIFVEDPDQTDDFKRVCSNGD